MVQFSPSFKIGSLSFFSNSSIFVSFHHSKFSHHDPGCSKVSMLVGDVMVSGVRTWVWAWIFSPPTPLHSRTSYFEKIITQIKNTSYVPCLNFQFKFSERADPAVIESLLIYIKHNVSLRFSQIVTHMARMATRLVTMVTQLPSTTSPIWIHSAQWFLDAQV